MHRWKVGNVVREDEFGHLSARCDRRSVPVAVVPIGIGLIHLPDFAPANEFRAALGRRRIGQFEDQFGACERGEMRRAILSVSVLQCTEGMHSQNEGTADPSGSLKTILDGGQAMERMDLIDEKPRAQIAGPAHAKQGVDGNVHPQGQQRPIEDKVRVGRGDEKDRPFLHILGHPLVDREPRLTLAWLGQEAEYVGVRIEGCPDRFSHLCG